MRNKFADTFYELGCKDERLVLICADISPAGAMDKFRKEFPKRFINTGVSEASAIGIAAGMAQRGFRPFVYTIATFALFRPYEQVRDDLCYQNLPVTVVGIGGGVTYSTLGATHHAMEDVTVAAALPNMTVLAPCDPAETEACTRWCATEATGPVYLRLGKAGEPDYTSGLPGGWRFGTARKVRASMSTTCILTYGPIVKLAMAVAERIDAVVLVASTLKPLHVALDKGYGHIIVIEESTPKYLGLRVRTAAQKIGADCRISTFSLQDEFIHCYGTHDDVLRAHGLSVEAIVHSIR